MIFYAIILFFSFLLSIWLTGGAREIGKRFGLVSVPRSRDVHKKPVPRIGGVAIFLAFLVTTILVFVFVDRSDSFGHGKLLGIDRSYLGIVLGSFLIVATMFFDDIYGLPAKWKIVFQILASLIAISFGIGIDRLANPFGATINLNSVYIPLITIDNVTYHFSLWSDLLTLVWLVGMMNVINFVDGIDGLAGGVSAIAAGTIFLLSISMGQPALAICSFALFGSISGFLVWNFPPAKIFMGDSGSMFLGYLLGVMPLISGGKLATAFLVLGFPIVDGIIVAVSRIKRGKNPFTTPDKTHLHHRFIEAGFTAKQAILIMYLISVAFAWAALRSTTSMKVIWAGILVILLIFVMVFLNRKKIMRGE